MNDTFYFRDRDRAKREGYITLFILYVFFLLAVSAFVHFFIEPKKAHADVPIESVLDASLIDGKQALCDWAQLYPEKIVNKREMRRDCGI